MGRGGMTYHVGRRISLLLILVCSAAFQATAQTPNTINTIAGGGTNSSSPTSAFLGSVSGVAKDSLNNVYILSSPLEVVYKVTPSGQLSIYAGTGIAGFSGDGGPASAAELNYPWASRWTAQETSSSLIP